MNARSILKHGLFAIIAGAIIHTIVTVVTFLSAYDLMSRNSVDDVVSVSSTVVKKLLMRNVCGLDAVDEKWGETLVEGDVEGTTLETDATNQSKWRNQSMSNLRKDEFANDTETTASTPKQCMKEDAVVV
eukprot:scaffold1555_cov116-Alexandrium_tamarense.AAC.1